MNSDGSGNFSNVAKGSRFVAKWIKEPLTCVKFDKESVEGGKIAVLTLSRPASRNAWTEIMRNEIIRCLDEASQDPNVRVVIVTGDPAGKAFCAGAELSAASETNPSTVEGDYPEGAPIVAAYARDGGGQASLAVVRSTKPVIAAVNGSAVGVGMTFPLSCDMTVAAEDAKVGFVFGKRGLMMEALSSYFLERCVGHKVAMELVLTGRVFKAKDAPDGLFNYVVPKDQVMPKAIELAKEVMQTSGMSSMLNRQAIIRNGYNTSPEEAHLVESKGIYWLASQPDAKEGIKSFLEKRDAKFPMDPYRDAPYWFPWWKETSTKSRL